MSNKREPKKVNVYTRVSSSGQNVAESVGNQRDALTAAAAAHNLIFYTEFVDEA